MIYQDCRTSDEIEREFDDLQSELTVEIAAAERDARLLEAKRDDAWCEFDRASREIDRRKDEFLDEVGRALEQKAHLEPLFTLRWRIA